jgi:YD repeat-containing protein
MAEKPIRFSGHALFEMKRRAISRGLATATIRAPGQVVPSKKGRAIYQSLNGRRGRLLLRVIVKEDENAYHVVTAYNQQDKEILELAMKVIYDRETDTLSIILRPGKVAESDETGEGLIVDYDKAGNLISIELLDASQQVHRPHAVEFALAGSDE